jgi:hypothetical protein
MTLTPVVGLGEEAGEQVLIINRATGVDFGSSLYTLYLRQARPRADAEVGGTMTKLDNVMLVKIASADKETIRDAAARERLSLSAFIRRASIAAAEKVASK